MHLTPTDFAAIETRAAERARWTAALAPKHARVSVREALGEMQAQTRARATFRINVLAFVCLPVCVAFVARVLTMAA